MRRRFRPDFYLALVAISTLAIVATCWSASNTLHSVGVSIVPPRDGVTVVPR